MGWIKQYIKNAEAESAAKLAKASSKGSPMRTRLRSLSSGPRKSPVKQLKMPVKEESNILSLPKVARKSSLSSPRSTGSKLGRQNSRSKSAKAPSSLSEGTTLKKKRSSSSAKPKSSSSTTPRPSSKAGGSRGGSRNGSRASSPRCVGKSEARVTKLGLSKKALQKSSWKSMEMDKSATSANSSLDPLVTGGVKKPKRKKKRVVPTTSS